MKEINTTEDQKKAVPAGQSAAPCWTKPLRGRQAAPESDHRFKFAVMFLCFL